MNLDLNDHQKLVLIILNEFRRPGPNRYEIVDRKLRSGYGSATITLAEPDTSKNNIAKIFGNTSAVKKPDEDVAEAASQPEINNSSEPEKHVADMADVADAQHDQSNHHEEPPVQPVTEPEKHVAEPDEQHDQSNHHEEPTVQPVHPITEPEKHVAEPDEQHDQSNQHEEPTVQPQVLSKEQPHQSVLCMQQLQQPICEIQWYISFQFLFRCIPETHNSYADKTISLFIIMIHNDSFHSPQSTVLPCAMWLRLKAQHLKVDLIKSTKPELRFNIQWLQHQLIQQGELQQPLWIWIMI